MPTITTSPYVFPDCNDTYLLSNGTTISITGNSTFYHNSFLTGSVGPIIQNNGEKYCVFNKTKLETYDKDDELIITIGGKDYYSKEINIESRKARLYRKREEFKQSLYNNKIEIKNRGKILTTKDLAELKAQETLREFISETEWRRYVSNGFIMVKSQRYQNRYYQIFRDERTAVWIAGKIAATLCIHTLSNCPPTDHVINIKTLAELDEDTLWASSNVFPNPGFEYLQTKKSTNHFFPDNNGEIITNFNAVVDNIYHLAG